MSVISATDKMFSAIVDSQGTRSSIATTMLSTAISYMEDENYTRAAQTLRASISYNPESTDSYNYLASAYLQLGKNNEAISAYKSSLQLDNSQAEIHVNLANVYVAENKTTEAEKEFRAAVQADSTEVLASYTYGLYLLDNDRPTEAITQFIKASRLEPNDGNINYAMGSAYNKLGRYSEAITQLDKAIARKGDDFYAAYSELGFAYIGLGDKDNANSIIDSLNDTGDSTAINYAETLEEAIKQPQILGIVDSGSSLLTALGASTPVYYLDISLAEPNSSKDFTIQFQFDSEMDVSSIMDVTKWYIRKGSGIEEGFYNNGAYSSNRHDAVFSPIPKLVTYDPTTLRATVTFSISQNSEGNATIDPSRLVFKFMGTDLNGRSMDTSADEYDGFAGGSF